MGIPLLKGRGLSEDDTADSEPVVVVSESLARRMAPEGSPMGLRIRLNAGDSIWRTVVGVVGDVKYRLNHNDMPMAYAPLSQSPNFMDNWVIRTRGDPMPLAGAFQALREEMDPEGTSRYVSMESLIQGSTAMVSARFAVFLLGGLAGLAALLAVVGVYGVLAYVVQLRAGEIGIQLALGAEQRAVVMVFLGRGLRMAGAGLGLGVLMAIGLGRILESQLFGVDPWDPLALGAAAALLGTAILSASYLPARKASRLDPVAVIKGTQG